VLQCIQLVLLLRRIPSFRAVSVNYILTKSCEEAEPVATKVCNYDGVRCLKYKRIVQVRSLE